MRNRFISVCGEANTEAWSFDEAAEGAVTTLGRDDHSDGTRVGQNDWRQDRNIGLQSGKFIFRWS